MHRNINRLTIPILAGLIGGNLLAQTPSVPQTMPLQGHLSQQNGSKVNSVTKMTFRLYRTATGGNAIWTEVQNAVSVQKGLFKTELGSVRGFPSGLFDGGRLWLGIQVASDAEMVPRLVLTSQAYAQVAQNALDVRNRVIHPRSVSVGGATVIDAGGKWVGAKAGLQGPAGPQGAPGPRGTTGLRGPAGPTGSTGAIGAKGDKGDPGAPGPRGVAGPQGKAGATGPQGPIGVSPFTGNATSASYKGAILVGDSTLAGYQYRLRAIDKANGLYVAATNKTGSATPMQVHHSATAGTGLFVYANNTAGNAKAAELTASGASGTAVRATASGKDFTRGVHSEVRSTRGIAVYADSRATTGTNYGVWAQTRSQSGYGIFASATSNLGTGIGIYGHSASPYGVGLRGVSSNSKGSPLGVHGSTVCPEGTGILGAHIGAAGTTKPGAGVWGTASMASNYGVRGTNNNTTGSGVALGVFGETKSPRGWGVYGSAGNASTSQNKGVYGFAAGALGIGVHGIASGKNGFGLYGSAYQSTAYAIYGSGKIGAAVKAFVHPHPKDPGKSVEFICLEGNEHGTYFRGRGRLVGKQATIEIPDEWKMVSAEQNVTVQLTPIRSFARLAVMQQSRDRIVVMGTEDCEFNYYVHGVRAGLTKHQPIVDNVGYRPLVRGVPFGRQFPQGLRDLLVRNGTLNADYTPNEVTAERLGWELRSPEEIPPAARWWLDAAERQRLADLHTPSTSRSGKSLPQEDK